MFDQITTNFNYNVQMEHLNSAVDNIKPHFKHLNLNCNCLKHLNMFFCLVLSVYTLLNIKNKTAFPTLCSWIFEFICHCSYFLFTNLYTVICNAVHQIILPESISFTKLPQWLIHSVKLFFLCILERFFCKNYYMHMLFLLIKF